MPIDARGELLDGRYEYHAFKDGRVVISWYGRPVTTLVGQNAQKFLKRVQGLEEHDAQLVVARATGNFKPRQRALASCRLSRFCVAIALEF